MSKVDELRSKYSTISLATFNKFVEADKTSTKKYLEYFLKSWVSRSQNSCPNTTQGLISLVLQFDQLLPYIPNKDIYAKEFSDVSYLKLVIARAEEVKEEKTFVREDHATVYMENEEFLLLQPLTHRGSLRYGAQTKWCTASKNDPDVFRRYNRNGLLFYLIDKKETKTKNYNKVAFYLAFTNDVIASGIQIYNSADSHVYTDNLTDGGWSEEEIMRLTTLFRLVFLREKKLKKSKDFVTQFSDTLTKLNFESLLEHLGILEQNRKIDYISDIQEKINNLVKNLNDARFTTAKN
jgi:hypothetical protein